MELQRWRQALLNPQRMFLDLLRLSAERPVMFVAGGSVQGYGKSAFHGLIARHPSDPIPWRTGPTGSMFAARSRYLRRAVDYRSVLGELIRDHLGATQDQFMRIIPGYASPSESLLGGGISIKDNTRIFGELDLV